MSRRPVDVRDTRDAAAARAMADDIPRDGLGHPCRPRLLLTDRGEGAELRIFLEQALDIPPRARRFSVTFEVGQAVLVSVDYFPQVVEDDAP